MAWCRSDSLELVSRSVLKSYEFSPAAVFVVGSRTMRIKLWSTGKYKKRARLFVEDQTTITLRWILK